MKQFETRLGRYLSIPDDRGPTALVAIGIVASLLYLFLEVWYSGDFESTAESIMVLTFFISVWKFRHAVKLDRVFQLMVMAIILPVVLLGMNLLLDYDNALRYKTLDDLITLFLFLPLAWWFGGKRKVVVVALVSAFLGLLLAVASDPQIERTFTQLMGLQRVDFGIHNAQHAGLLFGFIVLFCLTQLKKLKGSCLWWRIILPPAFLVGLAGLIATQTRAMFLGLLVCGLIALGLWIRSLYRDRANMQLAQLLLIVVIVVPAVVLTMSTSQLNKRLEEATSTIAILTTEGLESVPYKSTGIRLHSWAESLKWIAEKPLIGWGRKARIDVIRTADHFPERIKRQYGHLHNSYLELLLGYGLVGLAFVGFLWITLLHRIKSAADPDTYRFVFYGSIFFFVVNFTESYFFYWSGQYYFALLMGMGYTSYLSRQFFQSPPCGNAQPG